jgi:hypothetical protein
MEPVTESQNDPSAKTPVEAAVEHAVEALVYAPIGLLFEGASLLPQLVEKGRNQVTMARMIGKFAVEQGRGEATKAAGKLQDQAAGVLDFIGGSVTPPPTTPAPSPRRAPASSSNGRSSAVQKAPGAARQAARKVAGVTAPAGAPVPPSAPAATSATSPAAGSSAEAADLAIPDYDGLSASHVVNRLGGLAPAELEAVRAYEAANRGRKTILSKVAQLQST